MHNSFGKNKSSDEKCKLKQVSNGKVVRYPSAQLLYNLSMVRRKNKLLFYDCVISFQSELLELVENRCPPGLSNDSFNLHFKCQNINLTL